MKIFDALGESKGARKGATLKELGNYNRKFVIATIINILNCL